MVPTLHGELRAGAPGRRAWLPRQRLPMLMTKGLSLSLMHTEVYQVTGELERNNLLLKRGICRR